MSARAHLALGLASLAVTVTLAASFLGLVPDGEQLTRQHRSVLAESTAVTVSALLDDTQPEGLAATLEFLSERTPGLLSVGVRAEDGSLLIDLKDHARQWTPGPHTVSTDAEMVVPVWQAGQPWGRVELRFAPLRDAGVRGQGLPTQGGHRAHCHHPCVVMIRASCPGEYGVATGGGI
jgi:hypothetical protein